MTNSTPPKNPLPITTGFFTTTPSQRTRFWTPIWEAAAAASPPIKTNFTSFPANLTKNISKPKKKGLLTLNHN